MQEYLQVSEVIDWQHPEIIKCSQQITSGYETPLAIAKACFEWVRDNIYHSCDYQMNPVISIPESSNAACTQVRSKSSNPFQQVN